MRQYGFKLSAFIIVLVLWSGVWVLGGRGRYDFGSNFTGVLSTTGKGTGVLDEYGFTVANVDGYGMARVGCFAFGITNYNAGDVNLDGTAVSRNLEVPASGIEFLWEEGNGSTRFAIPSSGVGNATYNARSMLCAGPSVQNTAIVTVGYWQTQGIFHNLVCDTAGDGADHGVQNDLEVEGDIFTDSIKESTPGADITLANDTVISGTLTVNGDQGAATDHVFDDYDDIELLRKWRRGEDLPFPKGDILNQNRLLRDAIIQLQKQIDDITEGY